MPILGVCLGPPGIGQAFGGDVVRAQDDHARQDLAHPPRRAGRVRRPAATRYEATRYHSLVVERDTLPDCLEVTAWTETRRTARSWACATASMPVEGVQFHPESILTEHGHALLQNFLRTLSADDMTACHHPQEALQRTIEHREIFHDEMLST